MIEPYEAALRSLSQDMSKLGFSLVENTEYGATFSDGTYSIELFTERYRHPSLSGAICAPMGKEFEIGLVWQIVDPVHYAEDMAALKEIRERFGLGKPGAQSEMRLQGIAEYLRVHFDQISRFFTAHKDRVFACPNDYEAEYTLKSNALMARFFKFYKPSTPK